MSIFCEIKIIFMQESRAFKNTATGKVNLCQSVVNFGKMLNLCKKIMHLKVSAVRKVRISTICQNFCRFSAE